MSRSLFIGVALCAGLTFSLTSCSRSSVPRGTVKGKVTLDGLPLTSAAIFFESDATKTAMQVNLGAEGEFEAKSYNTSGLPVGNYKVAISPGGVMDPDDAPMLAGKNKSVAKGPAPLIPVKYTTTATSGLSAVVNEGDNPPFLFKLVK